MGERYWISGVQLGILKLYLTKGLDAKPSTRAIRAITSSWEMKFLDEIEDNQFLGRIEEGEKKKVAIVDL